jgi:hypothetical protein
MSSDRTTDEDIEKTEELPDGTGTDTSDGGDDTDTVSGGEADDE